VNPLRTGLAKTARFVARRPASLPLLTRMVRRALEPFGDHAACSDDAIDLLILNHFRYLPDLEELARRRDVRLWILPSRTQELVNAAWLSEIRDLTAADEDAYLADDHPRIRAARRGLRAMLTGIFERLRRDPGIDAVVSCTFYYGQDREWEAGAPLAGVASFALHKENMKDPVTHAATIQRYRRRQFRFTGTRIFLFNELEATVLRAAGCADPERTTVLGGLRMDTLRRDIEAGRFARPGRKVVFFSSHHAIGLLQLRRARGFFSDDPEEGFVEWFDRTHATVARFALENPDIEVWIKPKWLPGWKDRIEAAIDQDLGTAASAIPNLTIGVDRDAQTLIAESSVVVGVNSTTLLEAKLTGRRVVVPLLAEAGGKYFDEHIYFQDHLDAFNTVRTESELLAALKAEIDGEAPVRSTPGSLIADYLGLVDGTVGDKIVAQMRQDIHDLCGRMAGR